MDIRGRNRKAWDRRVGAGNPWTIPVGPEEIAMARQGEWSLLLTPTRPIPSDWYPSMKGADVLCLASGGGQQGPILAAVGANVTVLDSSPRQLEQDRAVAERDGLAIRTVEGDMRDLTVFEDGSFDLIVHPVSNCFIPEVRPVWREAFRVLRPGGALLAGFCNPIGYLFDPALEREGTLSVRFKIPYSDLTDLSEAERRDLYGEDDAVEFGHTLEDQIGGQVAAGFSIQGFYEDRAPGEALGEFIDHFVATRAVKPDASGIAPHTV
jgi:SAM-dependent methyltransferase